MFVQIRIVALFRMATGKSLGRVIAVTGVKGGVGASTIAHNLAFLISRNYDTPTVLADLDLAFGTAALNFNQDPRTGSPTPSRSNRARRGARGRLLSRCTEKLNLLAAPATVDRIHTRTTSSLTGSWKSFAPRRR
jgi:pilus assembly protein CpaE